MLLAKTPDGRTVAMHVPTKSTRALRRVASGGADDYMVCDLPAGGSMIFSVSGVCEAIRCTQLFAPPSEVVASNGSGSRLHNLLSRQSIERVERYDNQSTTDRVGDRTRVVPVSTLEQLSAQVGTKAPTDEVAGCRKAAHPTFGLYRLFALDSPHGAPASSIELSFFLCVSWPSQSSV